MWECVKMFEQVLGKFPENALVEETRFIEHYHMLKRTEKIEFIKIIDRSFNYDKKDHMLILSYLLSVLKDNLVLEEIGRVLLEYDYTVEEYLAINYNLTYTIFTNQQLGGIEIYKNRLKVREKYFGKLCNNLNVDLEYIPLNKRKSKKIIILIEPLLGEKHAPTAQAVNLFLVLKKIGYEPILISTCITDLCLKQADFLFEPMFMNTLSEITKKMKLTYFGESIECHYFYFLNESFIANIESAVRDIRCFNPEFIIEVGGNNIVADICSRFTTVLSKTCGATLPITLSKYILDIFDDEKILGQQVLDFQRLIKIPNAMCFKSIESNAYRSEYGIKEEDFVIVIVGNRLDIEIRDDFIQLMNRVIKHCEKSFFLIVGECDKLEEKLKNNTRVCFCGYVNNLMNTIGLCDLFLNPPRQGGGIAAVMSIEKNVPVLTMKGCDVASNVGDDFTCNNLEEMEILIYKYMEDIDFYKKQKQKTDMINVLQRQKDEAVMDEMKLFCKNVHDIILEEEKI